MLYEVITIEGPTMRDLIDQGYLTDYRIFAPPSSFHREEVPVSNTTGDFNLDKMRKAIASSSFRITSYNVCYTKLLRGAKMR